MITNTTLTAYARFNELLFVKYRILPGTIKNVKVVKDGIELEPYKALPTEIPQYISTTDEPELLKLAEILQGDVMHREKLIRHIWTFGSASGGLSNFEKIRKKLLSTPTENLEELYSKLEAWYSGDNPIKYIEAQLFTALPNVPTEYINQEIQRAKEFGLGEEGIVDLAINLSDATFRETLSNSAKIKRKERQEESEYTVIPEPHNFF